MELVSKGAFRYKRGAFFNLTLNPEQMDTRITVAPLNDLYQLVCDSIKGYEDASEKVKTPQLATFLSNLIVERTQMKYELGTTIKRLDASEDLEEGTLKGDLHRAWLSIREALSSSSDHSVLDECARGEAYLTDRYNTVMENKDIPSGVLPMLREQGSKVAVTRSTIEQLGKTIQYKKD